MIKKTLARLIPFLIVGMAACSSDGVTAPKYEAPKYEVIAGTYNGAMVGLTQGVAMNSTFSITVNQNGGTTSGSWGLSGVLSDGVSSLQIAGTGSLSGSVTQGTNPSVNLTFKSSVCPNYTANFSGSYDSANRRITISGPVDIFAADSCNVALRYNATIILTR